MSALVLFGLPPLPDPARAAGLARAFAQLLAEELGAPFEARLVASYGELADELATGRVDFAWLPPLHAARLARHSGVALLVQAQRAGRSGYHSVLFGPPRSPLQSLRDLAGKRLAFVHRHSASGYLVAASLLAREGIVLAGPPLFCGSHAAVVAAVREGRADAGVTFCTFAGEPEAGEIVTAGWTQAEAGSGEPMRLLAVAGQVPADTVCAWPGVSREQRLSMSRLLLELHTRPAGLQLLQQLFGAERFTPVDLERLASLLVGGAEGLAD